MKIIAGDIGGTKTLLQLCEVDGVTRVIATRSYSSRAYEGLEAIAGEFLNETAQDTAPPAAACFAVAGPVRERKAKITNLPWMLDAEQLAARLGIERVLLINDMQGVGYGIEGLDAGELEVLQPGEPEAGGTRAILAAGTGLGQGAMVRRGGHHLVLATEGGHADFAPRDETQIELLRYLLRRASQVSCEMLLCGSGLAHIYAFLRETGRAAEPAWLGEALRQADDPAAVISTTALAAATPPIARLALDQFVSIYGAQAGNVALTLLATGGVYLAGGIVPKIAEAMRSGLFINAFRRNAAMGALLERVPVYIVKTPEIGLLGARRMAARPVEKKGHDST
jgi:glucokinase